MADINHKLENLNQIQRPKKVLSEAKIKAMEKMKAGREAWLLEKKRCEEEGLPPPVSKKKAAAQKKVVIKDTEGSVEMNIEEASELESPEISVENNIIVPTNKPVKKRKETKVANKKKQVVVNNYYEEVIESEEEEESSSEEEEEEEIVNNHYRRHTTNPNPQYRLNNNQKTIRFV
tara:strand:+ start:4283 stop:4810 length:528 start_codon:yes stop_codon:yes gene_type:complete